MPSDPSADLKHSTHVEQTEHSVHVKSSDHSTNSITCKTKVVQGPPSMLFGFSRFPSIPPIELNIGDQMSSSFSSLVNNKEDPIEQFIEESLPSPTTPTNQGIVCSSPANIKQERKAAREELLKNRANLNAINRINLNL